MDMKAIKTAATSSYVSLAPIQQTEFKAGQKMVFEIDESLAYIKGRDSYLTLDVINTSSDNARWTFPNAVGASSIIKRVDIYSRSTGQLLETLDNYNQWCCVENQMLYDDHQTKEDLEGLGVPTYQYESFFDASVPVASDKLKHLPVNLDPTKIQNSLISQLKNDKKTAVNLPRRFIVPLKSGLFSRWWDDEKLCPVLNLGGLRIEILCASNEEVCMRLGCKPSLPTDTDWQRVRSLVSEGIKITDMTADGDTITTLETDKQGYFSDIHNTGLVKGMRVKVIGTVGGTAGTVQTAEIKDIATSATAGRITITLTANITTATGALLYVDDNYAPSYFVQKAELKVCHMILDKESLNQLAKPMKYEFTSYDMFLNTLPDSVLRHQIPINSVATKARAIMSIFMESNETTQDRKTYYSGLTPTELNLNSVQLFSQNKLYPLNAINPNRTHDKPLMINELNKAMMSINKVPLNLGDNTAGNLQDYSNTWLYARELARGDFVYQLRDAEAEVRLGFSGVRTWGGSRVNSFVFSRKIIDVSPKGLMVEL